LNFIRLVFRLGEQSADCGEQEQISYSPTRELKVQSQGNFWTLNYCQFCMLLELLVFLKKMLKFKIKLII